MIYLVESERGVYLCATNPDTDDRWESNAIELMDAHSANFKQENRLPPSILANVIRNVLKIANVAVE